ncbi:MAG: HAMP domain-containing histidine kinase [Chloroflexota bacterium]|nr:HAMP domain-containing histidine kinase [Chloroflexota bacterium]
MIDPAEAFEALLERRGGDVLLVVDDALRVVRAGPEAAELAERDPGTLEGLSLIAAFGSAPLDAIARQAVASGDVTTGEADLGHLGRRRFAVDAVPLGGGGLALSLHDITALRRIERVRRDFVANIGHELRTPLTSIKLLAETLVSGAADDAKTAREFAGQIEREADHLAQLVDELLDLSMIESGQTRLVLEPLDPDEVVAACAERIGPVAERAQVRISRLPSPVDGVRPMADASRLGQALINLAHNAVKYSHLGGEVRIGWEPSGSFIRFTVADDGVGVADAHQPRIFERFYKADRSRTRDREDQQPGGSAGLGLAIVRHIAEAHGGSVGLASEEGVGSTFWIEVPKAE